MDGPSIPQSYERFDRPSDGNGGDGTFGPAMQPLFLGNLREECETEDIEDLFRRPVMSGFDPIPVDRIDIKRGFGFVFLKDARTPEDKERVERYVTSINGMYV